MTERPGRRRLLRAERPDVDHDVQDEVAFHLGMQVDDLVAEGWTEDAARMEAARRFGDIERLERSMVDIGRSRARATRRAQILGDLRQDVRFALRQLRKRPGFALATVSILGLGVGANAAVFGVVDAALFRALPFPEHSELYYVMDRQGEEGGYPASLPEFEDWERDADFFASIAIVATSVAARRTFMLLITGFAGLALILAVLGIYAVTAQSVQQRRREIGLRIAVGARGRDVLTMVLRQEAVVVALGLVAGTAGAIASTRVLSASLVEVSATDPATLALVLALLAAIGLIAALVPALRASRVDPGVALRTD